MHKMEDMRVSRDDDEALPERLDVCLTCPPRSKGEGESGTGRMTCMSLDEQGLLMVTGCHDGRTLVWDLETRGVRDVLEDSDWHHRGPVESVLVRRDGCLVLSCHSVGNYVEETCMESTLQHVSEHETEREDSGIQPDSEKQTDSPVKRFVLWQLKRDSGALVVGTYEMNDACGRVSMCACNPEVMSGGMRGSGESVLVALITHGGAPMVLKVCASKQDSDIAKTEKVLGTVEGDASKSRRRGCNEAESVVYDITLEPLSPRVPQRDVAAIQDQANHEERRHLGSSSSGGTTITDTRVDDSGEGFESSQIDSLSIIGRHVLVYWDGDGQWFRGTVHRRDKAGERMFVVYEDGDEEWIQIHGAVPWKYADSVSQGTSQFCNVLLSYCPSNDLIAIYDNDSSKLTLHRGHDLATLDALIVGTVGVKPSRLTFSRDGSLLALTCGDGFIEVVQTTEDVHVCKKLDFFECSSAGRKKRRQHAWLCSTFSPSGTYLFNSMVIDKETNEHCILTWNHLENRAKNVLQGQGAKIIAMECHPIPTPLQIIALSDDGNIYIWSSIMHQHWSVFQPEFETLEENREYIEVETEFDQPAQEVLPTGEGSHGKSRILHDEDNEEDILID